MLDLAKLAGQIPGISQHFKQEVNASKQRVAKASYLLDEIKDRQEQLIEVHKEWHDRFIFSAAVPLEPIDTRIPISAAPYTHSVFATDGSQIAPSHHEIAYCYLINVGRVMLHYGQNLHPLLDSIPAVYYKAEDIYVSKQWGIKVEEWMGYRRTVLEAQMLSEMAYRWVKPPGAHHEPNLALVDGSLIYWFIDSLPAEAKEQILPPIQAAWEQLRRAKIPLVGYISASRSTESINFLRLQACPHLTPNCTINCGDSGEEAAPCRVIDPLRDASLWGFLLSPGERGPLWQSYLRILDSYEPQQRIYFCYLHVGTEIARIEIPAWVAEDKELFDRSLAIILGQVSKGYGYPVSLAEAHNQAVIRSADRTRFFALLEQQMIKAGMHNVATSYKEARKRGSIA
ncbi:MAG: hypothetical protein N5P05_002089 [Chroococcopsis gigantea SAG 12.99]|jgi:hypothetical protein|nr:DNA double-strand break repair nuclease NurA [Chlorogloea purpurea SAG 13.99]MDV3000483.1 hypothetical protein [Chroococcopsis gigantea SAG 12.99]